MRLIGFDPGLRLTGWGVIEVNGNRLRHVAHGVIKVPIEGSLASRLDNLFEGVLAALAEHKPEVVVHTAASYKDPEDWATDILVNGVGTANIAKASKTHKVGRLIYFQTALCYGTKPLQQPIRLRSHAQS